MEEHKTWEDRVLTTFTILFIIGATVLIGAALYFITSTYTSTVEKDNVINLQDVAEVSKEDDMLKQVKFMLYISDSDYKSLYEDLSASKRKFIDLGNSTGELKTMNVFEFAGKSSDMQEIVELLEEAPCSKREVKYDTVSREELLNKTMNNVVQYRDQIKLGKELIDKGGTNELLDKIMKELSEKLVFEEELLDLIIAGDITIIRVIAVQHYGSTK